MPDGTGAEIEVSLLTGFSAVAPQDWDSCACPEAAAGRPVDPFTTHRFLLALERSGSVGPGTGWDPRPLVARAEGRVVAVAPLFVKSHSQGEYIFDHGWADALERAGGRYYPKLQIAVPFTPATGRRFLTAPGWQTAGRAALVEGAVQVAAQARLSSVHVTFCTEAEATAGEAMGLLHRVTQQYHWENRGYADFGDFLAALSSRKRKTIRKEREVAQGFGGTIRRLTGGDIRPEHWDAFWRFYQDTGSRKWGRPYLTRAFFDELHETMRDDVLLVLAERGGRPVAGALNMVGRDTLFGRYWGAVEDHPCLHFECCYYQAIDFAIERRMARVEAGAQGEHKLARGYLPSKIHSLHWIGEPSFRDAVARYLRAEGDAVGQEIAALADYGPFRKES
ncbi:GNAT family N-acetyltransferase [Albidovulum sp.]|uniref:GNAT family N-acetyltransferase n=1 Tax=Albidovulum sp. TaxID=1872424 RepID=UPI003D7DAD45